MAISFNTFFGGSNHLSLTRKMVHDSHGFSSYEEALEAATSAGYERRTLVNAIVQKTLIYKEEVLRSKHLELGSTQTLLGLVACGVGKSLNVLDFGGGAGIHYFQAVACLGSAIGLRWNVVETPSMVAAATAQLQSNRLKFFTSIESAVNDLESVDLVVSNSSLPYSPNPILSLDQLLSVRASHVFVSRTPLSEERRIKTFLQSSKLSHNGPGSLPKDFVDCEVQYPITVVPRQTFESQIKNHYSIRFWSREDSGPSLRGVGPTQNYLYFLDLSDRQPEGN